MGDVGDDFRAWREHKKQRAQQIRAAIPKAMTILRDAGISFDCMDHGEHYRVAGKFDWWPSTGHWRAMDGKSSGYRVRTLIAAVQAKRESSNG